MYVAPTSAGKYFKINLMRENLTKKFNSAVVQLTRLVAFSCCAETVCTAEDAMRKRVEALKEASTPKPPFALCYVHKTR